MPTPNKEDIILVQNIDLDCDHYDTENNYYHSDYFEVRWNKQPFRVKPGETRRFPRYIAEHFAKHLADHILIKKGEKAKKNLLNHPVERPKVLNEILIRVEDYYNQDSVPTEGEIERQKVEEMNRVETVPAEVETKKDIEKTEEVESNKTKKELIEECKVLGIELDGSENKEDLEAKIKAF